MIALALALLLPLGAGGCTPQKEGSAGILYRVTGGKSELYLLGSIHVGSEDMYPMGQSILDALADLGADFLMQEFQVGNKSYCYPTGAEGALRLWFEIKEIEVEK